MNNSMEKQIYEVSLDDIIPNRFQPRLTFDEEAMQELTASIKEYGVIEPLVLRRLGDKYEIIAGERRYKASTLAGLDKVPAIIMNLDDNKSAEVALIENVQRKQLTAIEEAKSYQQLLDRGYLTQEELAKRLGKSQPGISNKMRLLNLTEDAQEALLANKISERHARSLLTIKNPEQQIKMLNRIINERLTVRQADLEIKKMLSDNPSESEEGAVKMIKEENMFINNEKEQAPIEPITPIMPHQQQSVMPQSMPSVKDNNNFINLNQQPMMPQTEQLDMDMDFQDVEQPNNIQPTAIDNLLKPQNDIPRFNAEPNNIIPNPNENRVQQPQFNPQSNFNPQQAQFSQPMQQQKRDIRPVINDIRQVVNNIQRNGFVVKLEEFDSENTYQVVIKINK